MKEGSLYIIAMCMLMQTCTGLLHGNTQRVEIVDPLFPRTVPVKIENAYAVEGDCTCH